MANKALTAGIGLLVVIGILLGAQQLGVFSYFSAAEDGVVDGVQDGVIIVESSPEDISLTYNDFDLQDRSNDPASVLLFYSPDRGNTSDDGSITVGANDVLKAIAGYKSTTYFAQGVEVPTGNKDPVIYEVGLAKAGKLTLTTVNDDSITKNSVANPQTLDANDKREMDLTYDVGANLYFGAPAAVGKSVLVLDYDKTYIKSVDIDGATGVADPRMHTTTYSDHDGTVAFLIDNLVDGAKDTITLIVESTASDPGAGVNVTATFYSANVDFSFDAFAPIAGVEDEDGHNITLTADTEFIDFS